MEQIPALNLPFMNRFLLTCLLFTAAVSPALAQQILKDELVFLTPDWKGERFADGRPKVSDALLKRMKLVTQDRKSTRLNSSHLDLSRMPSSA